MITYIYIYLVCIASPLLGLAEPIALLAGLSSQLHWPLVVLSVMTGQMTCFIILYQFSSQLRQRIPWLQRKLDAVDLSKYDRAKPKLTALAGLFGLPPATVLALAGPIYQPRFVQFIVILAAGRTIRFIPIAAAPAFFAEYFDPSILPDWVTNIF